jgi:hypothetical protein
MAASDSCASVMWLEQIKTQDANTHTKHTGNPAAISRRNEIRGEIIP